MDVLEVFAGGGVSSGAMREYDSCDATKTRLLAQLNSPFQDLTPFLEVRMEIYLGLPTQLNMGDYSVACLETDAVLSWFQLDRLV